MTSSIKPNGLKCEVCGKPLHGKQRRACSQECRSKLGSQEAADRKVLARTVAENLVTKAVQDELDKQVGPVVQEVLTDQVLTSIRTMVFMMPAAIEALSTNLQSNDEELRHKAAALLLRYTMGNPSVAPPSLEAQPAPLQVNFTIPRAEAPHTHEHSDLMEGDVDSEGEEMRECMECHLVKPLGEFVGKSHRCTSCQKLLEDRVQEQFGAVQMG
jgi:hypothetical protein